MSVRDVWRATLIRDRPLGLWPLSDGYAQPGARVEDLSGRGRLGTVTGGGGQLFPREPGPGPRHADNVSMRGNGITSYVSMGYASWMDVSTLTIEFWFKIGDIGATQMLMGRDDVSSRPWVCRMNADGSLTAYSNNSTGPVKTTVRTGLDNNQWHHFGWAYEAPGGTGLFMVDGAVDSTYTGGGTLPAGSDTLQVFDFGTQVSFTGNMAFVAMFGSKLTPAQIRSHYEVVAKTMPGA